jgi:hypothetical protein
VKTKLALVVMLALNVALAGTVVRLWKREPSSGNVMTVEAVTETPTQIVKEREIVATVTTNMVQVDWNMVESTDYRNYIANLRRIGCPPETVRDIILADVNKLFASRFAELKEPPIAKSEFWKPAPVRGADEDLVRKRLALTKEKKTLLKELLGEDIDVKEEVASSGTDARAEALSFLPKEKLQQVSELDATYNARINKLLGNKIRPSAEEVKEFNKLETEKRGELAKALSPQELEDYNLRASRTANVLRSTMGDFAMTEQEFRDVFKVRQQFDEKFGVSIGFDDAERSAARWDTERQIRATMGEQRYTDYVRERDWSMSTLQNIAKDFEIPKERAVQVFDVKLAAQEMSDRIRFDQQMEEAQRREALQALQDQTKGQVGRILGEKAMDAYTREGFWIRNLAR